MAGRRTFRALGALFGGAGDVIGAYQESKQREARTERLQDLLSSNDSLSKYSDYIDPHTGELDPFAAILINQDLKQQQQDLKQQQQAAQYAHEDARYKQRLSDKIASEKELLDYKKKLGLYDNKAKPVYSPSQKRAHDTAKKFATNLDFQKEYLSSLGYKNNIPYSMDELAGMIERGEQIPRAPREPGLGERFGNFFGSLFGNASKGFNQAGQQQPITTAPQNSQRQVGTRNVFADIDSAFNR